MKRIVETTSSIMLVDPTYGDIVWADRPCVVNWSSFFEARAGAGQIKILHNELPNEANDADFLGYLTESGGDTALAIEAYASSFAEPEKEPEKKPAPRKAAAKKTED